LPERRFQVSRFSLLFHPFTSKRYPEVLREIYLLIIVIEHEFFASDSTDFRLRRSFLVCNL